MTSLHNASKLVARNIADPESSDSGEDDEENDRRNRVTIHEVDCSGYNETDLAASLTHQKTSLSSVAKTGKPEEDPTWDQFPKHFLNSTIRPLETGEMRHLRD